MRAPESLAEESFALEAPSPEAFRLLFASHPQAMWVGDCETYRILEVNEAAVARYGWSREEFLRRRVTDLLDPEELPRFWSRVAKQAPACEWTGEWRHRRADRSLLDVELTSSVLEFAGRRAVLVVAEDVTERQRAAEALRQSEHQYRSVIDNIKQVIFQTDARGVWTLLNTAWTEITGFTVQETLGTNFLKYVHPADRQRHAEAFQPLLANREEYFGLAVRYLTKAGGYRWIEVLAQLTLDDEGRVRGMFGTLTDITERKRAEEELLNIRARLEHLLVSSPAVIYSAEASGDYVLTFVSDNIERQLGYAARDVLRAPRFWMELIHPEDVAGVKQALESIVRQGSQHHQYRVRHADGHYRWIYDELRLVDHGEGATPEIVGSWVDVTEHLRAEEDRARLSSVVEQAAEAIVITATDGLIDYVNPAMERLAGYSREELIGRNPRLFKADGQDPAVYREMWTALAAGRAWTGRFVNRRKDGTTYEVEAVVSPVRDASGRVVSYAAGMHDVTHQRDMEEQLRQAQKMEIAGRLAGGVAHDFNNLLTVIAGRGQLLLQRAGVDEAQRHDIELIQETAARASALTRQLLVFSRKQVLAPRVLDINAVVANMEKMLRRLIGEDIELVTVEGEGLGRVKADPGQLEQVIMNLAVNARDAMPDGGRLTIETANVELDETRPRRHVSLRPGRYVVLSVGDTGCGIPSGALPHIFEPFFTTKEPDKGTGLGLSTVYGIVKQSEGEITVESAVGKGTTVCIYLPRVEAALESVALGVEPAVDARGTETILLAEDEEEVRGVAREALTLHGYRVLEARHGRDALELARAHPGPIHLLVTDVVMPQMGGLELARRLVVERPSIRVVYMSGYTDETMVHHRVELGETGFIEKPFLPTTFAARIRAALDAPAAAILQVHTRR